MKMRFALLHVPALLCRVCVPAFMCVSECQCVWYILSVWSLMSAGGCYCLQMWALGNQKTQSLWSIPEPLPLYIVFSSSTHNLSPFLSFSLTHTHILSFFPSIFHLSSASATPHLCPPSPTPTLTLSLCFIIYYCSLLFVSARWTFFLSALLFPLFLNPLPPSLRVVNTSLLPSLSSPLLPPIFSPLLSSYSPPFWPSITCVHAVGGGVLIARLADRSCNGRLAACVCVFVFVCMVGCLRNSPGNNSPDRPDGCRSRQAGGVRGAAAGSATWQATFESNLVKYRAAFKSQSSYSLGNLFLTMWKHWLLNGQVNSGIALNLLYPCYYIVLHLCQTCRISKILFSRSLFLPNPEPSSLIMSTVAWTATHYTLQLKC